MSRDEQMQYYDDCVLLTSLFIDENGVVYAEFIDWRKEQL